MAYKIHVIDVKNALQNYIWLIEHQASREVIVIDPTEANLVQQFCHEHQLTLKQIWLTHWHKDHIGGVMPLIAEQHIAVYGPRAELSKIPFIDHPLDDQNQFYFHDLCVDIIAVPGHTLGHIVYFIESLQSLFSGDTLFAMGCGRLFEGSAEQMFHSLNRLAALPIQTQVYCTHEYTLSNAEFAITVEPDNLALQHRLNKVREQRKYSEITLPSNIELELATNPFLRAEDLAAFTKLRQLKDNF